MYAIVKTGGKQYKVAVGDVVEVEKIVGEPGTSVDLPALLLVDGDDVTTDADALAKVAVTGEVVAHTKGPKIKIHHFKNKTGYHRRMGHRQPLTQVKVTGIERGKERWHNRRAHPAPATAASPPPSDSASSGTGGSWSTPARSSSASAAPSST